MEVQMLHGWIRWSQYHDKGDENCFACTDCPVLCECGGLSHIQLAEDNLNATETLCDRCGSYGRYALGAEAI